MCSAHCAQTGLTFGKIVPNLYQLISNADILLIKPLLGTSPQNGARNGEHISSVRHINEETERK